MRFVTDTVVDRRLLARVCAPNGLGTAAADATVPTVLWCRYTYGARTHGSRWVGGNEREVSAVRRVVAGAAVRRWGGRA